MMQYVLPMMEGILTFVSPCLLPMLPLYVSFFMGQSAHSQQTKRQTLSRTVAFVMGFTVVFMALNLFFNTIGLFASQHQALIAQVSGGIILLLGLDTVLDHPVLSRLQLRGVANGVSNVSSPFLFGMIFAVTWSPCVGTFLAAILSQAAASTHLVEASLKMLAYCLGLGLPFIFVSLILEEMQTVFKWLKQHHRLVQWISGGLLMVLGFVMLVGWYHF